MVVSAALLIRERGAHSTAISDVLKHSGAPRGSAYHYFPGGRMQLLEEAIDYAGAYIAGKISAAETAVALLDELIEMYRQQLIRSDYRAGCPIVAVTVEAGDPDNPERREVIERAAAAFEPLDRSDRSTAARRRRRRRARRGTRHAGDDVDRGRDHRRPSVARRRSHSTSSTASSARIVDAATPEGNVRDDQRMAVDRLHPVRVQLRHRRAARGPHACQDPRRQGASRVAGLHVQQGAAARPLPEQPQPADVSAASARPTAVTRRSTGTPRSPRSPRASRASATSYGGDKIFYYGGGGQGNHLGGAYSGAFLKAHRLAVPVECAGAGEDRRALGRRAPLRRPHPRRVRARRGVGVRRQEPVDVAELPAGPRRAQRDRQGSRARR